MYVSSKGDFENGIVFIAQKCSMYDVHIGMYIYVCMYIYISIYMYIDICIYMYIHLCVVGGGC